MTNSNVVWSAEDGWHDGPAATTSLRDGRLDITIRPGVNRCADCGRAYNTDRAFPSTGDRYDGEIVRAVGVCSICDGATVKLNCVIVHHAHNCDTHAPSIIDAVTGRPL